MSSQDWEGLSGEEKESLETRQEDLQKVMRDITRQIRHLEKEAKELLRTLECDIANHPLAAVIDELKEKYGEYEELVAYLEAVRKDILENLDDFKDEGEQQVPIPGLRIPKQGEPFLRYQVNTIVDHGATEGAPVVVEWNPSFYNLVGRLEYRATMGTMTTDFTMIKAGALHRANGGYVVIQALDLLRNYMAWDALKRAIRNRQVFLEDMNEQFRVIQTQGLKPEPIPLDVKVILVGSPLLYNLLYEYEEDFPKLFKVKADFGFQMDLGGTGLEEYAGFMAMQVRDSDLLHFDRTAMARITEFAGRLVDDQERLTTRFVEIANLMREADYFARQESAEIVTGDHVKKAIEEKIFRSNRIEERLQELIVDGTILVDTEGAVIGQINGLAVLDQGDYRFGKPSRLTARVYSGRAGIIQIDRDTKMAGSIHNKGVMILQGFFGDRYAKDSPLSISASLTFEQLYGGVDGDSASSTELYSLLSALARVPIRQDLAVTGSVNQHGEVQAIGGVNEKIEGWFYTCKAMGLTGEQGVLIPESNTRNLMLNEEVVEAVREGRFNVYPITHIDEGIELLTGMPAGQQDEDGSYPVGSINYRVEKRLENLAQGFLSATGSGSDNDHTRPSV
jgi:lon-related putative ATP-dependent protease